MLAGGALIGVLSALAAGGALGVRGAGDLLYLPLLVAMSMHFGHLAEHLGAGRLFQN